MVRELAGYGPILRYERELRGWSQYELVKRILDLCAIDGEYPTLDVKTVGRWEWGKHRPSPYYRKRLCQLFGRDARELGFIK